MMMMSSKNRINALYFQHWIHSTFQFLIQPMTTSVERLKKYREAHDEYIKVLGQHGELQNRLRIRKEQKQNENKQLIELQRKALHIHTQLIVILNKIQYKRVDLEKEHVMDFDDECAFLELHSLEMRAEEVAHHILTEYQDAIDSAQAIGQAVPYYDFNRDIPKKMSTQSPSPTSSKFQNGTNTTTTTLNGEKKTKPAGRPKGSTNKNPKKESKKTKFDTPGGIDSDEMMKKIGNLHNKLF